MTMRLTYLLIIYKQTKYSRCQYKDTHYIYVPLHLGLGRHS